MPTASAHERWTRKPFVHVGGKLRKPLTCSSCNKDLFTVYEQKPLRRSGTTKRVGIFR